MVPRSLRARGIDVAQDDKHQLRPAWQALLSDAREIVPGLPGRGSAAARRPGWTQAVDAVFADVWDLTSAILVTADRMARSVPGHAAVTSKLRMLETAVLREVKTHLDEMGDSDDDGGDADQRAELLDRLLAESRRVEVGRSNVELHLRMLRSLVPDEARVLATMASGERYPMLHIEARGPGGAWPVLTNACTVGRIAAIHQQNAICVYLGHLRNLGLVHEGPREDALSDQYALLRNEDYVHRAIEKSRVGRRSVVEVRRTLQISPLGSELWAACHPAARTADTAMVANGYRSAYAGLPPMPRQHDRG